MGIERHFSNLTAGELTPALHARDDLDKYQNGVATALNMVILPHGGLRRRPGLSKIEDSKIGSNGTTVLDGVKDARIDPFVFNVNQKYVILFRANVDTEDLNNGTIEIFKEGIRVAVIVTPYNDINVIKELDVIQSADTMIITHETIAPYKLLRQGSDTSWDLAPLVFVNQPPQFDFGSGPENVWSDTRGWPGVVTFHQNRLWLAGSTERPTTIWASKINGFFDFDTGTGAGDDAIDDTLDSDSFNKITNIFPGRELQIFTTGAEYYNAAKIITPADSEWRAQTGYGSKRLRPINIDGATLFVDSSKRTIRQFLYDFNEGAYVSLNLTLLSSHLLTDIRSMAAIKGTSIDVGDYVYAINEDGSCAVLNTMRNENIQGWTHWVTDGRFLDVVVLFKDVYFLVEREGSVFLEKLTEDTYTDHNVIAFGEKPTTYNIIAETTPSYPISNVIENTDNVVYANFSGGTPINTLVTNYHEEFQDKVMKVVADFSIQDDAVYEGTPQDNSFTITRIAYRLEVGINFVTQVSTLPYSINDNTGNVYYKRKKINKVDINVLDSLGVYARDRQSPDREFTVVLDEAPKPFTGFREMYLLGWQREASIDITQKEPLPFILRGIGLEIV